MIFIELDGGLGNQMFQYAFGRAMAEKYDDELKIITTKLKKRVIGKTKRDYELHIFNIKKYKKENKYKCLNIKINYFISKKIKEKNIEYSEEYTKKNYRNVYLMGYWQSEKYFKEIEEIIREEFQFKEILDKQNKEILTNIQNTTSVSLHIRRGDYVNNSKTNQTHGTCTLDYYNEAIKYICEKINDPVFYIFSDDMQWVEKNFKINKKFVMVTGNQKEKNNLELQLMSNCKHNIIANSSFSWWGAWLNTNKNKIVVAPRQWFADEEINKLTKNLIPDRWKKI